jgi:DNA-directed RNA polymerase specialized sigma24 family protein
MAGENDNGQPFTLDMIVSETPTADFIVTLQEEYEHLLGLLRDDRLRQISALRVEGHSVSEIAEKIGIGNRAVERKLQLIRAKWSRELGE